MCSVYYSLLDALGKCMSSLEGERARGGDNHVREELIARAPDADASDFGNVFEACKFSLHTRRQFDGRVIEQRIYRLARQAQADPDHNCRDAPRGHGIGLAPPRKTRETRS